MSRASRRGSSSDYEHVLTIPATMDTEHENIVAAAAADAPLKKCVCMENDDDDKDGEDPHRTNANQDDGSSTTKKKHDHHHRYYHLTPRAVAALPQYQYSGMDLSLLYKYILSPLATFLVYNFTPRTMAPNTITLLGLIFMIIAYLIVWYYCPTLSESMIGEPQSVPSWIFAFNSLAMLIYQTLDNMDGKQARRTGTSSPLGLLFDHGCDAFNSILGSANWICAMGLSPASDWKQIWVLIIAPMAAFYVSTWEEFHTGTLILPFVNGPNEGLLMGSMLSLTTALWGAEFWHGFGWYESVVGPFVVPYLPQSVTTLIPNEGIRNCDLVVIATLLALGQEMTLKTFHIGRKHGWGCMLNLFPFLCMSGLLYGIGAMNPQFVVRNPRTVLHLISGLFCEMTIQLMVDHVTTERYQPFRMALVPLVVLFGMLLWGGGGAGGTNETDLTTKVLDDYLLIYTTALWVYFVLKMRLLVFEICSVLKIWCFDIVNPYPGGGGGCAETAEGTTNNHKDGDSANPGVPNGMNGSVKMLQNGGPLRRR